MPVFGYTRLSQESDVSIERQKRHIREYCDEHDLDLARIYDDGEHSSGFETESRNEYQKLRGHIHEGDCEAIVVNDKRRLARDIDEVMRLIPDLRTNNSELHTYQDGQIDLSDPMRAAIEILQAAAAHQEKMEEIKKAIEAVDERLEKGYDHGPPRFGMEYDDAGHYQVPSDDFEKVERVWDLRDRGESYPSIEKKTGVPVGTAHRIVENRDWYEKRAELAQ